MTDALAHDLAVKHLTCDRIELTIGYDVESLTRPEIRSLYHGRIRTDRYGRSVPWPSHGHCIVERGAPPRALMNALTHLYDTIVNPHLLIRRITISAQHLRTIEQHNADAEQLDLFSADEAAGTLLTAEERRAQEKEKALHAAVVAIKQAYGKNAILRGANFIDGATMRQRNGQIGGHKA